MDKATRAVQAVSGDVVMLWPSGGRDGGCVSHQNFSAGNFRRPERDSPGHVLA